MALCLRRSDCESKGTAEVSGFLLSSEEVAADLLSDSHSFQPTIQTAYYCFTLVVILNCRLQY